MSFEFQLFSSFVQIWNLQKHLNLEFNSAISIQNLPGTETNRNQKKKSPKKTWKVSSFPNLCWICFSSVPAVDKS